MRMRIILPAVVFSLLLFLVGGCVFPDNTPPPELTTQTLEVSMQSVSVNLQILFIGSDKPYLDRKQDEVRSAVEAAVNSGEYNIVAVKTSYTMHPRGGYLTAAEVTYDASGRGDGNALRVKFLHSEKRFWDEKSADIKSQLNEMIGLYDIVKINTLYAKGYLLAAEMYYREVK